jgi:hypothetical protein
MTEERIVHTGGDNAVGEAALIHTIVWSIVVLVVLALGLWAFHVDLGLF